MYPLKDDVKRNLAAVWNRRSHSALARRAAEAVLRRFTVMNQWSPHDPLDSRDPPGADQLTEAIERAWRGEGK